LNFAKIGDHLYVVKKDGKSELELKANGDPSVEMAAIAARNAITVTNDNFLKAHQQVSDRTVSI
jgi:hypothetical protein